MLVKENKRDQEKNNRKPSTQHLANRSLARLWLERALFEAE